MWAAAIGMGASIVLGLLFGEHGSFHYAQLAIAAATVAAWLLDPKRLATPISAAAWRAFAVASLVWLEAVSLSQFAAFNISGVDFSIFDWAIASGARGHAGYSPIYDVNLLGVHSSFLLLALVPFHALAPSPLWLLLTGPLVLWLTLFPLRRLVRRCVGEHGGLLLAASLATIAGPHLGGLATAGFRIESFTPLGTLWFLVGWTEQRRRIWIAAAAVLFLTKEDSTLYLGGFAFAVAVLERPRRAEALLFLAVCVASLGLYRQLVQPALAGGWPGYMGNWQNFGLTPGAILVGMASHPGLVLERLASSGLIAYFAPLLFLPWLSWRAAAGLAPTALLLGTASYAMMHDLRTYYATPLFAFAVFGVLDLTRGNESPLRRAVCMLALLLFPVIGFGYATVIPFSPAMLRDVASVRAQLQSAPHVCGQTVLFPHLGYPADLRPLFELSCAEAPETWVVVSLAVDPSPLTAPELASAIARWRLTRQTTEVGRFLIVGPP